MWWYYHNIPSSRCESLLGHSSSSIGSPGGTVSPTDESNTAGHRNTTRPLTMFTAQSSVSPTTPASNRSLIAPVLSHVADWENVSRFSKNTNQASKNIQTGKANEKNFLNLRFNRPRKYLFQRVGAFLVPHRYKAVQIPDHNQIHEVILQLQSISSKEGLHNEEWRSNYKAPVNYQQSNGFYRVNWPNVRPKDSPTHFMCTDWDAMELVRNQGHGSWARHGI